MKKPWLNFEIEMMRSFGDNPTCRHIIFGGCHDSGYLTVLDHIKHNEAKMSRITLLETTDSQAYLTSNVPISMTFSGRSLCLTMPLHRPSTLP
jgi:hypothetical protein